MKQFKDLTDKQKSNIKKKIYNSIIDDLSFGIPTKNSKKVPDKFKKKLLDPGHSLCGCYACLARVEEVVKKDNEFKEYIVNLANSVTESAYYFEDEDSIINIHSTD